MNDKLVYGDDVNLKIKRLLKRLDFSSEGIVLLHESETISPYNSKVFYDAFRKIMQAGTLSIVGDVTFNADMNDVVDFPIITTQERIVLSSGKMLQLLVLDDQVSFASHPALMIGSVGKFAKFFARQTNLDFPFGEKSIFKDYYELNSVLLFVGEPKQIPEIAYAISMVHDAVIRKNSSIKDGEIVQYLDYDVDTNRLTTLLKQSNILLFESMGTQSIYGISFRMLVDFIKKHY